MAAVYGADPVYDFSLGNPNVPAPAKVKEAVYDILENEKADRLEETIQRVVSTVENMDEQVSRLAREGLMGQTVEDMVDRYLKNWRTVNEYVMRFSKAAITLRENAERMEKVSMN